MDKKITFDFLSSIYYKQAEKLLVYISSDIEVDTKSIVLKAINDKKEVYAPRCVSGTNIMDFYRIYTFNDLEAGNFGILEPRMYCKKGCFDDKTICLVPALAYDNNGYRLGFGKGFYDVYLSEFKGIKIGICYDFCITNTVFRDDFDIPVDIIFTDKKEINIK